MPRIVVLLFVLVLGAFRPSVVNANQDQPPGGTVDAATFEPTLGAYDYETTKTYINYVVGHADQVWTRWFLANNLQEPFVYYVVVEPGSTYTQRCSYSSGELVVVTSTTPNAFYCDLDTITQNGVTYEGFIYLPLDTMLKTLTGEVLGQPASWPGDFALATVIAHEFGHHIVSELSKQIGWTRPATTLNRELLADCFAGIWAHAAYQDNLLVVGDVEEAISALQAIGDQNVNDPDFHGTPEQRDDAWRTGFYGTTDNPTPGLPTNCITKFWS